jgi:hypothetical protein
MTKPLPSSAEIQKLLDSIAHYGNYDLYVEQNFQDEWPRLREYIRTLEKEHRMMRGAIENAKLDFSQYALLRHDERCLQSSPDKCICRVRDFESSAKRMEKALSYLTLNP